MRAKAGQAYRAARSAGVLRRLLQILGPGFSASEFDADAWTLAEADLPGLIGFYQAATPSTALASAETVLAGYGAIRPAGKALAPRLAGGSELPPHPAAWQVSRSAPPVARQSRKDAYEARSSLKAAAIPSWSDPCSVQAAPGSPPPPRQGAAAPWNPLTFSAVREGAKAPSRTALN